MIIYYKKSTHFGAWRVVKYFYDADQDKYIDIGGFSVPNHWVEEHLELPQEYWDEIR